MRITLSNIHRTGFAAVLLVLMLTVAGVVHASSINQVSLQQVAQNSVFIFQGKVISKAYRTSLTGQPFTYFTYKIISVIKGSYVGDTIELGFMGGPKNGMFLEVSDMIMPKVNESGVYFVESLSRQQVHPLYGWSQGHYLIIPDSQGQSRVVPVRVPPSAASVAPTLAQFKANVISLIRGVK